MKGRIVILGTVVALAGVLALGTRGAAQVKQGKTRALSTKHMMSGLIGPNTTALGKAIQGEGPADDKAWDAALSSAELLNESGYMLMDDGRCPDGTWAASSKQLQDSSAAIVAKIKAKDAAGAREIFTSVTGSCKSCHTAHKK